MYVLYKAMHKITKGVLCNLISLLVNVHYLSSVTISTLFYSLLNFNFSLTLYTTQANQGHMAVITEK
jgi:hypothetical protein